MALQSIFSSPFRSTFHALSAQVLLFLNNLYSAFDALLESHDVFKVETIGDRWDPPLETIGSCCTVPYCSARPGIECIWLHSSENNPGPTHALPCLACEAIWWLLVRWANTCYRWQKGLKHYVSVSLGPVKADCWLFSNLFLRTMICLPIIVPAFFFATACVQRICTQS